MAVANTNGTEATPMLTSNPLRQEHQVNGDNAHLFNPAAPTHPSDDARDLVAPWARQRAVELTLRLQTTLEVEQLVEFFSEELRGHLGHSCLYYTNDRLALEVKVGRRAPHSCAYNLLVGNQPLGELVFCRHKRFSAEDQATIEYLLGCLIYPLRNALMYFEALETANRDPLTGTGNRMAFESQFDREITLASRHGTPFSLMIIDVDHFKRVNDRYGHLSGDCVLRDIASIIQRCIRTSDLLFRYGGEEFVLLLSNTECRGAHRLAERIRKAVEKERFDYLANDARVSVSIGGACLTEGETGNQLFQRADAALYSAKAAGRNRVEFSSADG